MNSCGVLNLYSIFWTGRGTQLIFLHFFDREDSPITEVEPYLPFNINPSGMQPVLTTSYFLAFPGFVAR